MNRSRAARPTSGLILPLFVILNAIGVAAVYAAATVDVGLLVPVVPAGGQSPPGGSPQAGAEPPSLSTGARSAADARTTETALADREDVLARPLFRADRRPWQPSPRGALTPSAVPVPEAAIAEKQLPPLDLRLVGLVRAGEAGRALIRLGATPATRSFGRGDIIGGWRLIDIGRDRIVLEALGERREVMMDRVRGDEGPPPVPPVKSE